MRIRSFSLENTREGPITPLRLVLAAANLSRRRAETLHVVRRTATTRGARRVARDTQGDLDGESTRTPHSSKLSNNQRPERRVSTLLLH